MRRPPVPLAALVAAVTVVAGGLLAACGGGGTDRLSRSALDRRAAAVCAEGQAEADRLRAEADPAARGEAAALQIDATLEALDTQVEGFEDLRGPPGTDDDLEALVGHLRDAGAGLEDLRRATVDDDITVDDAIAANPDVVDAVNRSSARAADTLVALGWLTCVGIATEAD